MSEKLDKTKTTPEQLEDDFLDILNHNVHYLNTMKEYTALNSAKKDSSPCNCTEKTEGLINRRLKVLNGMLEVHWKKEVRDVSEMNKYTYCICILERLLEEIKRNF
jgi:hypothetical protein